MDSPFSQGRFLSIQNTGLTDLADLFFTKKLLTTVIKSDNIYAQKQRRAKKLKNKTKKIVISALMAALTLVATIVIKIPTPMQGYIHLGDALVLVCGWLLGPVYGFCAAAIGSAMADILSGYMIYAPATFVIKGLVALVGLLLYIPFAKRTKSIFALIISAFCAELVMVGMYYIYEGILYGFIPSLVNIPANLIQGLGGVVFGVVLMKSVGKYIKSKGIE